MKFFYVGKGTRNRYKDLNKRNDHFKKIYNKYDIAVDIVKDNLTDEEASDIECYIIHTLVFDYGFSIDIKNNEGDRSGCHLVNQTWGGEGSSGCIPRKETRDKMSKSKKGLLKGIPKSEEAKRNMSINHADFKRSNHPQSRSVICLTTKRIFKCITDGADFYKCDRVGISNNCRRKDKSSGKLSDGTKLIWRYINYKHNKKYRVVGKIKDIYNPNYINKELFEVKKTVKPVICLTTKMPFKSIRDASIYYKVHDSYISTCCKGRQKSAGKLEDGTKLVWKYINYKHNKKYRIKS